MEELGINLGTNLNSTYVTQDRTVDEIIQSHATTLEDVFDIKLQQREKNLPQIYWIPNLHKTPYRARFIAGSSSCTTTRLSKLITKCLKLVRSHCAAYCKTAYTVCPNPQQKSCYLMTMLENMHIFNADMLGAKLQHRT